RLPVRLPRRPAPPLFPYTTLFRSVLEQHVHAFELLARTGQHGGSSDDDGRGGERLVGAGKRFRGGCDIFFCGGFAGRRRGGAARSEEHTSELQSRENLVCRRLLEK